MITDWLAEIGSYFLFLYGCFRFLPRLHFRKNEVVRQIFRIGNESVGLITITAAFTGLVTAVQAVYQTKGYIPIQFIGVMVGKSTMTELAPVLTALVMTGKVGASMAAEIGTMNVSEQIDALRTLAIEPADFLYLPRILAGIIVFPLLTIYADFVGILTSWVFAFFKHGISFYTFFNGMRNYFLPSDLWGGLVKSIFFGLIITSIGCYTGSRASGGAEGVGKVTTQTVVYSAILILIMDFFVAWFLFGSLA
ncbi:MAG TPA: ABC transporter permease [Candidatus Cloacimonadota bacterium]|nr:ABC transporter permease [Candidatus Cloacimonadota bacterium]HOV16459.1 ABC transporter permease [Candidatus Cloacimonadota bacterium]HQL14959.1 ABC transporter permease [Candidatus Cloacimonadota bacterium]